MQYHVMESARERALDSIRRRRMEVVRVQERAIGARPGTAVMFISKGHGAIDQLRGWFLRFILPLLSADCIEVIEII